MAAAVFTMAAALIKGPVGLFPLTALAFLSFANQQNLRGALVMQGWYLGTFTALSALLIAIPASRDSLMSYVDYQLVGTFSGTITSGADRAHLANHLLRNLVPLGIITLCFAAWKRYPLNRQSLAWLAIALSASVPLFLSPRHNAWYLLPALPFYALFFTEWLKPGLSQLDFGRVRTPAALVIILAVLFAYLGSQAYNVADNDQRELADTRAVKESIEAGTRIGSCYTYASIDRLTQYLYRHHKVVLETASEQTLLVCDTPIEGYEPHPLKLESVTLYRRADS